MDAFSESRLEWTAEELIKELGFTRPTAYRYLKTLKEAGFLTMLPNSAFTLGPKVVELDYLLRRSDIATIHGAKHLENLTSWYECSALIVRWYGDKLLCMDSRYSSPGPLSSYPRGRPMPLGRGAIARSILSFMPRKEQERMLEWTLDDLRAVGLGSTREAVQESLRRVKKQGYAVAYGEVTPGVVGIAAPILDHRAMPVASLCVTIAGSLIVGGMIEEIGERVRTSTAEIGAAMQRHGTAATPVS